LREKAEQELEKQFDIKSFHDLIPGSGALLLDFLERSYIYDLNLAGIFDCNS
jgi:uncharacterized protein (DUF885 family)